VLFILVVVSLAAMEISNLALESQKSVISQTSLDSLSVTDNVELNEAISAIKHDESVNGESYVVLRSVEGYAGQDAEGVSTTSYVTTTTSDAVAYTLIGLFLLFLSEALYLRVVSAILGLGLNLKQWLAFAAWSHVPGEVAVFLTTFVLGVMILVSTQFMGLEMSTLTRMIEGPSSPYHPLGYFLDLWYLAEVWCIVVQTIGFREWSGKGTLVSFAIVVVPFALFHGLTWWAFT